MSKIANAIKSAKWAILSSVCCLVLVLAFSISLGFREFVLRHPGLIFVFVAVAGEVTCDWKTIEGKWATARRAFAVLLVLGLAWELIEATETDKEAAKLNERSKQLESTNLNLQLQLEDAKREAAGLELQAANSRRIAEGVEYTLTPRKINQTKSNDFILFEKNVSKEIPIGVWVGIYDNETMAFARQIASMLQAAGFKYPTNEADEHGIIKDANIIIQLPIRSRGFSWSPVVFIEHRPGRPAFDEYCNASSEAELADGVLRQKEAIKDTREIFKALCEGFKQAAIVDVIWMSSPTLVKPGEFKLVVMERNN